MTKKKIAPTLLLVIQSLFTAAFVAMLLHVSIILFSRYGLEAFKELIFFYPIFIILVSSLSPQIVLRIRRKLHSEDGEIFPILFTVLSMQASLIIPLFIEISGWYFMLPPEILIVIERFSVLATASIFLLSALEYYGFQNAKLGLYTFYILLACLIVCMLAPTNTNRGYIEIYNAYSDAYIIYGAILIYITAALTLIGSAINEKSASNIRKCVAILLMILGIILSLFDNTITAVISSASYLIGIIILDFNTKDSF